MSDIYHYSQIAIYAIYLLAAVPIKRLIWKSNYSMKDQYVVELVRFLNCREYKFVRKMIRANADRFRSIVAQEKTELGVWIGNEIDLSDEHSFIILDFHAGGFVIGNCQQFVPALAEEIEILESKKIHTRIFGVEYPLAPEHPFPEALEHMMATYKQILDLVPSDRIILQGASAGGNMVISGLLYMRKKYPDLPLPRLAITISPWTDLSREVLPERHEDIMHGSGLIDFSKKYCSDPLERASMFVSPVKASKKDFKSIFQRVPILIAYAGLEVLHDDISEMVDVLKDAGCNVEVDFEPKYYHTYQMVGSKNGGPIVRRGLEAICNFIERHVKL